MTERTDQLEQHRTDADLEEERAQTPRRESEPLEGSEFAASSAESGGNYANQGATASDTVGDPLSEPEDDRIGGESPSPDQPADEDRAEQGPDIGDVYRSGS